MIPIFDQAPDNRITVPVNTVFDVNSSAWENLPELPAVLGPLTVQWSINDDGKIETDIGLNINGTEKTVSFWDTDLDGVCNNTTDTYGAPQPWQGLSAEHFEQAIEWGKQVHQRICAGVECLITQAAPAGSAVYEAIIAYATGSSVPSDLPNPKEMSLNRAKAALAIIEPTGSDAGDFRALMIDLWELARIKGVDLQTAVETAKAVLTYTDIAAGTHSSTP